MPVVLWLLGALLAACSDANCLECPNSTEQCTRCKGGYKPDFRAECVACSAGYSGENCEDLTCGSAKIKYCNACTGSSCQECVINYKLANGKCVPCDADTTGRNCVDRLCNNAVFRNCKQCAEGQAACAVCDDNYYLDAKSCRPCTGDYRGVNCTILHCSFLYEYQYCTRCGGYTYEYCAECWPGYYWGGAFNRNCIPCKAPHTGVNCNDLICGGGERKVVLPYCTECDAEKLECTTCKSGYYLRDDKQCIPCPGGRIGINCKSITCYGVTRDYCTKCSNTALSNACIECQDNYRLDGFGCVPCPEGFIGRNCMALLCNDVSRDYCTECSKVHPTACQKCKNNYYVENGICIPCPDNCETCQNKYSCQLCKIGHSGTVCENATCGSKEIKGCMRCSSSGKAACVRCAAGYYLQSDTCVKYPACFVPNCGLCTASDAGKCQLCISGYFLQKGFCLPCTRIPGCASCTINGTCTKCVEGAISTGNPGADLKCIPCSHYTANCDTCTAEGICQTCVKGHVFVDGICVPCPDNCRRCHQKGFCHECQNCFYRTETGACAPCIENCLKCSTPDTCGICIDGYRMDRLMCKKCPDYCRICTGTEEQKCLECLPGSFMRDALAGECVPCLENCITCSNTTACEKCRSGFSTYTDKSTCSECTAHCEQCKGPREGDCTQPSVGYYLSRADGKLLRCAPHCVHCADNKSCIEIEKGYYFDATKEFIVQCPTGCAQCSPIKDSAFIQCVACSAGYNLVSKDDGSIAGCTVAPRKSAIGSASSSTLLTAIVVLGIVATWIAAVLIIRWREKVIAAKAHAAN